MFKKQQQQYPLALVVHNLITSNTSRVKMIRMDQNRYLRESHLTKRLWRSREAVHQRPSSSKIIAQPVEEVVLASNYQMMKTKTAMIKRMLSNQKKTMKVMMTIIKTVATSARRLAVYYAVMDALKLHISLALASRSRLKEIGIA